jgi:hypothetical protein
MAFGLNGFMGTKLKRLRKCFFAGSLLPRMVMKAAMDGRLPAPDKNRSGTPFRMMFGLLTMSGVV